MALATALLFQDRNFVGREYFHALDAANRRPDLVIAAGRMSASSIEREKQRTGGGWNPAPIPPTVETHRFTNLNDPDLARLLIDNAIDVAIQGGVGILKPPLLDAPKLGFVNVHPGRLPHYRGNSCPEWAIHNGDPVVATAHLIDSGIDTGPVICTAQYQPPAGGYEAFRAGLYAHCAQTLITALCLLEDAGTAVAVPQDPSGARYWPPIPATELAAVARALSP